MQELPDYGEHTAKPKDGEDFSRRLNALVEEARQYEMEVIDAEQKLKDAKSRLRSVVEDALPSMMQDAGMSTFTTLDGQLVLTLKEDIQNSVPADRRNEAWDWLEKHGHGDIIKRNVVAAFGINDSEIAEKCASLIQQTFGRSAAVDRKVEPSTLKALLRDYIEKGKSIPRDMFGVREVKKVQIKSKSK